MLKSQMSKYRSSRFKKFVLFLLFVGTVLCLLLAANKVPQIVKQTSKTISSIEKTIKFGLTPSITVRVDAKALAKTLPKTRAVLASGPLQVSSKNPRYFTNSNDSNGKVIYLTGAHTWANFQDSGRSNPPPLFDYSNYLDFLLVNNHNFFRLWTWEQSGPWIQTTAENYWFKPMPYQRTGPGMAQDREPKFDLNHFNQVYFDRLHARAEEAGKRGIYVSIMLFNGWSVDSQKGVIKSGNPWKTHPFNLKNNINGIDGDLNHDGSGEESHTLASSAITEIQEKYVRKIVDTVNDLDNVLYEISNESHNGSRDWQYHTITYIKNYEAKKGKQHPVGMTATFPNGDNSMLFASPADWISPLPDPYSVTISPKLEIDNPPTAQGRKVVLADTDHLCGVCGDPKWVWKSFTRGENPVFMDTYDGYFARDTLLEKVSPSDPLNYQPWISLRHNLGYTLTYANQIGLAEMQPRGDLASTGYCLASLSEKNAEYLIYSPLGGNITVDLSFAKGDLIIEWLSPNTGMVISGTKTTGGGNRTFIPPFEGDTILYVKSSSA
jgi:Family of unknown function (DUF6298)